MNQWSKGGSNPCPSAPEKASEIARKLDPSIGDLVRAVEEFGDEAVGRLAVDVRADGEVADVAEGEVRAFLRDDFHLGKQCGKNTVRVNRQLNPVASAIE